jgi:hypothetical protein
MKGRHNIPKVRRCSKNHAQRAIDVCKCLHYKEERYQINNPPVHLEELEKEN